MKKKQAARTATLQREYQRLSRRLAEIGYISQGSTLDRSTLRPPRSGYQWTRKVAQKTITVALSAAQFQALKKAKVRSEVAGRTLRSCVPFWHCTNLASV